MNLREGCQVIPGWTAMPNDTVLHKGDLLIARMTGYGYSHETIATGAQPPSEYRGWRISSNYSSQTLAIYALYRKDKENTSLPLP